MEQLTGKKTVNIKGVQVDDWELLTEIAAALGLRMADMIHVLAEHFRVSDALEEDSILGFVRRMREERQKFVIGQLRKTSFGKDVIEKMERRGIRLLER